MKIKLMGLVVLMGGLLFLTGCARGNMALNPEFFKKKGTVGLVWTAENMEGGFYREGGQGLMDMVVSEMAAGGLPSKLHSVTLTPLVDQHFLQPYSKDLAKKEVKATLMTLPLDKKDFKKPDAGTDQQFWVDFREYKKKGLDYIVYVDVTAFGAQQHFFSVFATGDPKGYTQLDVYVVETTSNDITAEYHVKKAITVKGKWDNPPEYPEMVQAVTGSLQACLEDAYLELFELKN